MDDVLKKLQLARIAKKIVKKSIADIFITSSDKKSRKKLTLITFLAIPNNSNFLPNFVTFRQVN